MLKKRIVFTLLFNNGHYMLSRNFRLQKVGDLNWLKKNYVFSRVSFSIDELIILDVTRGEKNEELFRQHIKILTEECFIPIAAGGGIRSVDQARKLLRSGADKIVINTSLYSKPELIYQISKEFGSQCIVASVDVRKENDSYYIFIENGSRKLDVKATKFITQLVELPIGEIYYNSIDRDGTGQGYLFETLNIIPGATSIPIIIAGGVGKHRHLSDGLRNEKVDAVATAHLFNFVGDGLEKARTMLLHEGFDLARWDLNFKNVKSNYD